MFAFGHLVPAWIIGKIIEWGRKKPLSYLAWAILLGAGILPDIDLIPGAFLDHVARIHHTFTHSFVFMILSGLVVWLFTRWYKQKYNRTDLNPGFYGLLMSTGILIHLFMDMTYGFPGVALFWPLPYGIYFSLGVPFLQAVKLDGLRSIFNASLVGYEGWGPIEDLKLAVVDMGIGVLWIGWLWWKKRIKF